MNEIAPLLHSFYNGNISPEQRGTIHAQLLEGLKSSACISAAAEYIQSSSSPTAPVDPLLLHYSIHAIESLARNSFSATPPYLRTNLLKLLVDFLIASFARNARLATSAPQQISSVPAYALNKAARAAVELGKREWVADSTHEFPKLILSLIDQNGHTAASLPRIFTGMSLVAVLVEDSLDTTRKDMRSTERATLLRLVRQIADGIVAALEIGVRINGPGFPRHVTVAAVRAMGSLLRVETHIATDAIAVLKRSVHGRVDRMGAETLGVLGELFGEGKMALPPDWANTLAHAASLLEPVAMGETAKGDSEDICLYRLRLVAYGEAVMRRVIAMKPSMSVLERVLNGMMGVTARWASESPDQFPAALESWMNVLEALEDAEVESDELLERVYSALSQLCVQRCLISTNREVLEALEGPDDDAGEGAMGADSRRLGFRAIFEWDDSAELMAEVAAEPVGLSAMVFMPKNGNDDGLAQGEGDDDLSACSRAAYAGKCVESLVACARMSPERVGMAVAEFSCRVLKAKGQAGMGSSNSEAQCAEDLGTAVNIAYCVVPLLQTDSGATRMLFEAVCELVRAGAWRYEIRLGVMLLRTTSSLVRVLSVLQPKTAGDVATMLLGCMREVLRLDNCPERLATAACLVILELDRVSRPLLFANEPPLGADVISTSPCQAVAALGMAGLTHWALVPPRDSKGLPVKWTAEEWAARGAAFRTLCEQIFAGFMSACSLGTDMCRADVLSAVARGAGLFRTMLLAVGTVHGDARDWVWRCAAQQLTERCLTALRTLQGAASGGLDAEMLHAVHGVMGCAVAAIGSAVRVCARQSADGERLVSDAAEVAIASTRGLRGGRLADAALRLLRDGLVDGRRALVAPAVALATEVVRGGGGAGALCVSVLSEALRRFWMAFWPGDVPEALRGANGATATDEVRAVYFTALDGVVAGVQSADLSVCRAGLLALQALHASKRLFAREEGFPSRVRAAVVAECVRICGVGSGGGVERGSVGEEALQVVWEVASVDFVAFYGTKGAREGGLLARVWKEVGGGAGEEGVAVMVAVCERRVQERNGFFREMRALVNDVVYLERMVAGPSL